MSSVLLEESVAEWLCTAAGSGLLVPSSSSCCLHHYHHHRHCTPPTPTPHRLSPCTTPLLLSLGNCLRALPACSVIGQWRGGVPSPDSASCTDCCVLVFRTPPHSTFIHAHIQVATPPPPPTPPQPPAVIARQHTQASLPTGSLIGQSRMAQTSCSGVFLENLGDIHRTEPE